MADTERNQLTCTNAIGTLVQSQGDDVDATTRKLVKRKQEINIQIARLEREREGIDTALTITGGRADDRHAISNLTESLYSINKPFRGMTLRSAIQKVLRDNPTEWLSKTQIEVLIATGGYEFTAKSSKNSVGVTLQRMKYEQLCYVQRTRGAHGNRYRWLPESWEKEREDAATTNDKRK
jgi:hypothetical protein